MGSAVIDDNENPYPLFSGFKQSVWMHLVEYNPHAKTLSHKYAT